MAYKFQLGAATMSGSLKQEGSIDIEDSGVLKVQGSTVVDASRNLSGVSLSGSNTLQVGGTVRLDGVADATADVAADSFYFLDGDNLMKRERMSDYASTIAGTGLKADAGVLEVRVSGSIIRASDKLGITGSIAGSGLGYDGGVNSINALSVNVDDTGIEISSDSLRLKDNGVTLAKMAGLARGKFIVGDSSGDPSALALGSDAQMLISDGSDLAYVSLSGDVSISNTGAVTIANDAVESGMLNDNVISGQTELAADGLAAADELMISDGGTLKKIGVDTLFTDGPGLLSAATIAVGSDHFVFLDGGATGDAKTESIADLVDGIAGTTSATGLDASSGVLSIDIDDLSAETIASGDAIMFNDDGDNGLHKVTFDNMVTKALPLLTEAAITVADDYVVFLDGGASGDGKKEKWADIVAAIAGGGLTATNGVLSTDAASAAAIGDTNSMLSEGMNFGSNTFTADRTWTLPGSPTVGDVVHVKAPGNLGGYDLTVQRSGSTSHTIDGQTSIELESNGAAVSLMYVAANNWVIF